MRMQFSWNILASFFLVCICLSFGLCDKNNHQIDRRVTDAADASHHNGKHRPKHDGIPLRDDGDYIRENEENQRNFAASAADDDYLEEKYYDGETKASPTPKTSNTDVTAPGSIEMCPNECSCLNDFMTCTRPHLKHLPKVPQYIQSLELSQNNFEATICEEGIRNLPNLIDLKLNDTKLERIPMFHGLIVLETLELANNEIRQISLGALLLLPNLRYLDLSRNFIVAITTNSFPKDNILQKLFLNNNQIAKLERRAFEPLIQLNELKINKNQIAQWPVGIFTKLKKLKKLDLANNQLTELQKGGLLNITSLTKLNLSNNSIHTIGKNCWEFTQRITHLDISLNKLTEINIGSFDLLIKLKELDLHGNQISTISSGAMNATYNLKSLDLSQNRISATIEDSFGPFASLSKLDTFNLNDNHIKAINKNSFLGLTSLTRLYLDKNIITTIQDGTFDQRSTPELQHLHINSTEMICDCNLSGFYFWAKNIQTIVGKRQSGDDKKSIDVRCAFPASLKNKRLLQLHNDNLTCYDTRKPQMINQPKTTILAIKGTNITIECAAFVTDGSDITFIWKHDNVDLDGALIETETLRKDENILRVRERLVERPRELNRSPLRINVGVPKIPLITSSSVSNFKIDETDDEFKGESDNYEGESADEVIATVEDIEAAIPANSTIATSRLQLTNVDPKFAGWYNRPFQCIASNDFGKAYSQEFKIIVASFPVFTKQPMNITVRKSEEVRLDCAVDADPKPQIYWMFNCGNDFPAARERRLRLENTEESIIINNAKASDRGVYTCTAENPAGFISVNVTVDIIEPLIYIKPMEHKDVVIDDSTVLECLASGHTLPKIRWFKNSKPILESDIRFLLAKENQLLIIEKTTEDDVGLYSCELENSKGIERTLIQLKVKLKRIAADEMRGYDHDEITAIIIVPSVFCFILTSIVWIVILYKSKKDSACNGGEDQSIHIVIE